MGHRGPRLVGHRQQLIAQLRHTPACRRRRPTGPPPAFVEAFSPDVASRSRLQVDALARCLEEVGEGGLGVGDAAAGGADLVGIGRFRSFRDQVLLKPVCDDGVVQVPVVHDGHEPQRWVQGSPAGF